MQIPKKLRFFNRAAFLATLVAGAFILLDSYALATDNNLLAVSIILACMFVTWCLTVAAMVWYLRGQ